MRKKRILFSTEFSRLNTGYACIAHNLLTELYNSGKYEIAEHSRYLKGSDPHHQQLMKDIPWKAYPNLPDTPQEEQIYNSHPSNEFGSWKFEQVCLDFLPDLVCDFSDFWMSSFIDQSPFRRFFKTVFMPTCDSTFQNFEWLDGFQRLDHVLTYTKFAYDTLKEEGGGLIPLRGVATPAFDDTVYKPVLNKREHKTKYGLPPDSIIIGMVARNQRRKLFPDFASAFAEFLERMNFKDTENIFLYWHTSHPDVGWNLPDYIKNNGLSHKIIVTYFCHNCKHWFPSLYQDVRTVCPRCNSGSAMLSNSQIGIDNAALAEVYNFMDLYVQFVTNEGLGIPCLEAAACGCPIAATYYSGTQDLVDNLDGFAIPLRTTYIEAETSRVIAFPCIQALAEYIHEFTRLPSSVRTSMGMRTAALARKFYGGWERVARTWMDVFDSIQVPEGNQWAAPPDLVNPNAEIPDPQRVPDDQFVMWLLAEYLHRPDWVNSYVGLKMLRDLNWCRTVTNNMGLFTGELSMMGFKPQYAPCDRKTLFEMVKGLREKTNACESARHQMMLNGQIKG